MVKLMRRPGTECPDPGPESPLIYLSTQFIQAKEYFEAIVASTSDAIITTDFRGNIIYFSPGAEKMFGYKAHEALSLPVAKLYAGGGAQATRIMKMLLTRECISDHETVLLAKDGRRVHAAMSASLLRDRSGRIIGTLGVSKDITRRVELENKLRELSITDNVTGLFNRRCFQERAAAEVQRAKRLDHDLSVLVMDLDRFKQANDRLGHLEGDRILAETAGLLKRSIRQDVDSAYRYGGDEFVVVLPGLDHATARKVARRIRDAVSRRKGTNFVTLSIGVASLRKEDEFPDLLRRADARMYRVKRRKKSLERR